MLRKEKSLSLLYWGLSCFLGSEALLQTVAILIFWALFTPSKGKIKIFLTNQIKEKPLLHEI